jgi:hypothetical protein
LFKSIPKVRSSSISDQAEFIELVGMRQICARDLLPLRVKWVNFTA